MPELEMPQKPVAHEQQRSVFFGENGLRAGWSALLFLVLVVAFGFIAHLLLHPLALRHPVDMKAPLPPGAMIVQEVVSVLVVLAATFVMSRIEGRPLRFYGYSRTERRKQMGWGAIAGFTALSFLVAAICGFHFATVGDRTQHGFPALDYAVLWGIAFIGTAVFEEALFRGYLLVTLTRGLDFKWAAIILAILFGAIHGHNPGESPVGLFAAAAVGLVFSLSVWYTGSLWWAMGFHAAWDWAESYFWGSPDSGIVSEGRLHEFVPQGSIYLSGGPTGPEGSLFVFVIIALVAAVLYGWWGRRGMLEFPRRHVWPAPPKP